MALLLFSSEEATEKKPGHSDAYVDMMTGTVKSSSNRLSLNGGQEPILGFVILSHAASPNLNRLVATLNRLYDHPPIVIHHDSSQSPLPLPVQERGPNISIVEPHLKTRWADFSIVDAFLIALEFLYEKHSPDWFVFLSTECYPAMPADDVLNELATSPYDAYVESVKVTLELEPKRNWLARKVARLSQLVGLAATPAAPDPAAKNRRRWINGCYYRYVASAKPETTPFSSDFECYAGELWLTANAKAAKTLIASRREHSKLFHHYCNVFCPDESYWQTILNNRRDLRICPSNRRYAAWSPGDIHPKELSEEDLQKVLESKCHFARKFTATKSDPLIEALDAVIFFKKHARA